MESSRIYLPDKDRPVFKNARERLKVEKGISHEEIRRMAGRIAREIKEGIQKNGENMNAASVILRSFDETALYKELREISIKTNEPLLEREEIVEALKPIKIAILRELKIAHPDIRWFELSEDNLHSRERPINRLSDKRLVKEIPHFGTEHNEQALRSLYDLPDRSPFIAYHHEVRDVKSGLQISKEIPLSHLQERLREKDLQPFSQSML